LPKSQQSKAKRALQDIWMAETKITGSRYYISLPLIVRIAKPVSPTRQVADDRLAILALHFMSELAPEPPAE
jgi:hypothetical protein